MMNFFQNKKGKLIARVYGGLGNQLFMYAAAKRLALKNNIPLKLDIHSGFEDDPFNRDYCLRHFDVHEEIADPRESFVADNGEKRRYHARKINRFLPYRMKTYIEQQEAFESRLLDLRVSGQLYLQGYWQDERYFADIEQVIRRSFTITVPHDEENKLIAQKIKGENAVCLHARRQNYVHALPVEYYQKAIAYIVERVEDPHFYCFSDDPAWFNTLKLQHPFTIISHNSEEKNYEDLWLMQQCRHYIIANSTFSWWGAWLNPDPGKIVVAPAQWGYDTAIPDSWVAME
ncbi:MAG: alpha-1,2-fucosyltransferase [Proteobacteria bacterium]|nr:alpha-1,2-fucosyltransferase [Pseudomonadota bacterium]MBU1708655.1 alpha-1,2-fucosyltransferase [Pseudomonadota bacterium]